MNLKGEKKSENCNFFCFISIVLVQIELPVPGTQQLLWFSTGPIDVSIQRRREVICFPALPSDVVKSRGKWEN